jgi:oligosaccharyltransferase complex subunit epsilon
MVASKPARRPAQSSAGNALSSLWSSYLQDTPARTQLIDSFLAFLCLLGVVQFLYCLLVSNFPMNAFLGGFASTVGQFVLLAGLRIQCNPDNKPLFRAISEERWAYAAV